MPRLGWPAEVTKPSKGYDRVALSYRGGQTDAETDSQVDAKKEKMDVRLKGTGEEMDNLDLQRDWCGRTKQRHKTSWKVLIKRKQYLNKKAEKGRKEIKEPQRFSWEN